MRCHRQETLEPRWKGPVLVVLTTPTALKVDGIATWVHYTHVWPADLFALREEFLPQWKAKLDKTNPLKLKLRRQEKYCLCCCPYGLVLPLTLINP